MLLKIEGYECVNQERSFSEKLSSFLSITFKNFLPVINTFNVVYLLVKGFDGIYDDLLESGIKSGSLRKANADDVVINVSSTVKDSKLSNKVTYSKTCKCYDDMSIQEKLRFLENERNNALNEIDELMQERGFSRKIN